MIILKERIKKHYRWLKPRVSSYVINNTLKYPLGRTQVLIGGNRYKVAHKIFYHLLTNPTAFDNGYAIMDGKLYSFKEWVEMKLLSGKMCFKMGGRGVYLHSITEDERKYIIRLVDEKNVDSLEGLKMIIARVKYKRRVGQLFTSRREGLFK